MYLSSCNCTQLGAAELLSPVTDTAPLSEITTPGYDVIFSNAGTARGRARTQPLQPAPMVGNSGLQTLAIIAIVLFALRK